MRGAIRANARPRFDGSADGVNARDPQARSNPPWRAALREAGGRVAAEHLVLGWNVIGNQSSIEGLRRRHAESASSRDSHNF
jgi:hypothetical protein